MSITEEIKRLETEAQQGRIYRERYDELKNRMKEALKGVNEILDEGNVKIGKIRSNKGMDEKRLEYARRKIGNYVEELYIILKTSDGLQLNSNDIKTFLLTKIPKVYSDMTVGAGQILLTMPNVHRRLDGRKVFFYYQETSDSEIEKAQLMKAMPKKMSFMN